MLLSPSTCLAVASGIASHLLFFIRSEWHLSVKTILSSHLSAFSLLATVVLKQQGAVLPTVLLCSWLCVCYLGGLFSSIAVYRFWFHRLCRFPGPRQAALSKLWHVFRCRNTKNHELLNDLYKQYGPFVRTGPAEITIFHPKAQETFDGLYNKNTRSDAYDIIYPRVSAIFTRPVEDHRKRREVLDRALSATAIKSYTPSLLKQVNILSKTLHSYNGQPVPAVKISERYSIDAMGSSVFETEFNRLSHPSFDEEPGVKQKQALSVLGMFNPAPWLVITALSFLPRVWRLRDWHELVDLSEKLVRERLETVSKNANVATWIVEEYRKDLEPHNQQMKWNSLLGNAITLMVGASDTTSSTLSSLIYHLARYPDHADAVAKEVSTVNIDDFDVLATLPKLNAFMNESMRLLPAAATFGFRRTPPQGISIDGVFIPGDVNICTSRYTVGRMKEAYEDPESFRPERWFEQPSLIRDRDAFAPFGVGRRGCAGKRLALAQLRLVMARILSEFKVSFAEGTDTAVVERGMKDALTAALGPFDVVFRPIGKPSAV